MKGDPALPISIPKPYSTFATQYCKMQIFDKEHNKLAVNTTPQQDFVF